MTGGTAGEVILGTGILDTLLGNEQAKTTLVTFLRDGRLPHALLLEGEPGVGRRTFARLIAAAAVCTQRQQAPCGSCPHCRKALEGIHPDITCYDGAGSSRSFHIDVIRQLRADAYTRPNEADCKVFLLFEVQNMTVQAQNALLKILEEPPGDTLFVLTCNNRRSLLPTILSRVVVLTLHPLPVERCGEELARRFPEAGAALCQDAARTSGGNLGLAIRLVSDEDYAATARLARDWLEAMAGRDEFRMLALLSGLEKKREQFLQLLELVRMQVCRIALMREGVSRDPGLQEAARKITRLQAMKIVDIIDTAVGYLNQNVGLALLAGWLCGQIRSCL